MAEKINLRSSKVKEQKRRVADYGTETPLSSTAVERGSTRWLDGSKVVIEGLLDVTGTANVDGTLNVGGTANVSGLLDVTGTFNGSGTNNLDGTNNLSGTNHLTGPTDVTGQLDVTGPTTLAGTVGITGDTSIDGLLDINGDTKLTGNMDVLGGGKITVGNTRLSPSASNGGVEFVSGGGIGGNAGGVLMRGSGNAGFLANATALASMFGGASQIDVSGTDVKIASILINLNAPQTSVNGNLVVTGTLQVAQRVDFTNNLYLAANLTMTNPPTTTSAANMFIGGSGAVYKVTSASRFKLDKRETVLDSRLLEVPLMDWIDKYAHDNGLDAPRVPGVIAEQVHAAGGDLYITRNEDGEIEGVSYDRLALARTQILAHRIVEIEKRLESSSG